MKVAVFVNKYLAYSETFIHEEFRAHVRYAPEVFATGRVNAGRFPIDPAALHIGGWPFRWANFAPRFTQRLRSGEFAVVHAHFGLQGTRAAKHARRARLPLVITFHGFDVPLLTSLRRFTPGCWRYALTARRTILGGAMTLGLCASDDLREMLIDYGVPADKLRVWRLGIDVERFAPGPRGGAGADLQVIMVGRFVEKKGFEYGLRAFADQCARGAAARLTIVGDGERGPKLRALAASLGVADRVTFTGVLPSAEVQRRLATSDVILCPSVIGMDGDRESGLIVCKEASASACVPIGSWHGGIPEIIDDGVTGFLVQERNVAALSDRLGQLIADPALRARMGMAARLKMAHEYRLDERIARLEEHYDEARERLGLTPSGSRP